MTRLNALTIERMDLNIGMKMRIPLIITFLIIPLVQLYCINNQTDTTISKSCIDSISKKEFYFLVDSMPEYPGGQLEMHRFFISNFNYPAEIDACCKVIVEFIVDTTGQMTNFKIVKSLQKDFDNETLRVLKLMPKWKPGKLIGKPVNVKITFPLNISLQ